MDRFGALRIGGLGGRETKLSSVFFPAVVIFLVLFGRGCRSALRGRGTNGPTDAPDLCPHLQSGTVVQDPPILRSANGSLEVDFAYKTSFDSNGNPKFCYITSDNLQSPTLYLSVGDTLKITLRNELPANINATESGFVGKLPGNFSICPQTTPSYNAGTTNFHFHGMEVKPICNGDQVIHIAINPGDSYEYTVYINETVSPGNYWYHPHLTGDTESAIQGGATGSIVIAGLQNLQPAVQGLPERVFLLRDFLTPDSVANNTDAPAWDISINYVPIPFTAGYPPAIIEMMPDEVQIWDITNSAADTFFELQLVYDGQLQPMGIISRDGSPLRSLVNGQLQATIINQTSLLLGSSSRAQLLIRGPSVNVKNATFLTQYVDTGPDGDYDPERPIASIVLNSSRAEPALVYPTNSTASPQVFPVVSNQTVSKNRTLYFSEVLQDPSNPNSPTTFYLTQIPQDPLAFFVYEPTAIRVPQGAIEEWTIENRAMESHHFHIHQLHFTVLEANNIETVNLKINTPYVVGQFVETLVLPYWNGTGPYPSYKLLMDFTNVDVGDFVVHCHMAEHEDQGMTTIVSVSASPSN